MNPSFSQIADVASSTAADVAARSSLDAWAALASIWARLFVVAGEGSSKWPDFQTSMSGAMAAALGVAAGQSPPLPAREGVVRAIDAFEFEDDGSADWQHVVDLAAMLQDALRGSTVEACLVNAIRWYLEGEFNVLANEHAMIRGEPISHQQAEGFALIDPRWDRACAFVRAL